MQLGTSLEMSLGVVYVWGFGGLTTTIGISMIIYFIWVGILAGLMWKKSVSISNCNLKD
jgi:hypothetical protein